MDDVKYSRSVKMICSTCASSDFEHENEEDPYRCVSCGREFSRNDLISENGHIIEGNIDEVKAEVLKDASDMLRKAFSGSKHFRFK